VQRVFDPWPRAPSSSMGCTRKQWESLVHMFCICKHAVVLCFLLHSREVWALVFRKRKGVLGFWRCDSWLRERPPVRVSETWSGSCRGAWVPCRGHRSTLQPSEAYGHGGGPPSRRLTSWLVVGGITCPWQQRTSFKIWLGFLETDRDLNLFYQQYVSTTGQLERASLIRRSARIGSLAPIIQGNARL